ncbi:MAG: peptidoglycan editing factor PgeF [Rhodobacteraceae bacterium]|nr:peptidoglycan editing factor PgeF [Paracoccaceae bacterium]
MTLDIITSDSLMPHPHGFFTRRGGVSSGIFAGLNCGYGSSDRAEAVALNRAQAAAALGGGIQDLMAVHQIHSADVVTVKATSSERPRADGLVTDVPGILLSVLAADCQPVLFADPEAQVVGAAHAGWSGALAGVLDATLDAMDRLGADRSRVRAVIGPSVSQLAYEVGPEFLDMFLADDPENTRFFVGGVGNRIHFDLPGYGLHRLRAAGVGMAEWTCHCTYSDPDRFFSYRRSTHAGEADYGRLISAIRV